jgi:hypothetical protein
LGWEASVLRHLEQASEPLLWVGEGDLVPGGEEVRELEAPLLVQVREQGAEHREAVVDALMDEKRAVQLLVGRPVGQLGTG